MKTSRILSYLNFIHHKLNFSHKSIRNKLYHIIKENKNDLYDYGEGFYQSVPPIGLRGLKIQKKN